jgi:hypothetical protein
LILNAWPFADLECRMTRTFHFQNLLGAGLCVLIASACGSDSAPKNAGTGTPFVPAQTGDAGNAGGNTDAGNGADAATPPVTPPDDNPQEYPPESDAGTPSASDGGGGDDATVVDPGLPQSGVRGTLIDLPSDGEHLSICYSGSDCNGDDLECYAPNGPQPGFCTQDCKADSDCDSIQGVKATCSPTGQCQMGCVAGTGPCPDNMVCADLSPIRGGLIPDYRCVYPGDGGKNNVARYSQCDRAHGDGDCADAMKCHVPNHGDAKAPNTGYCADDCGSAGDCEVPADTTAAPLCTEGVCEFDCSARGATCPSGMACVDLDSSLLNEVMRCRIQ